MSGGAKPAGGRTEVPWAIACVTLGVVLGVVGGDVLLGLGLGAVLAVGPTVLRAVEVAWQWAKTVGLVALVVALVWAVATRGGTR